MTCRMRIILSCMIAALIATLTVPLTALADDADSGAQSLSVGELAETGDSDTVSEMGSLSAGQVAPVTLYRMYNMNSGEHFYTSNASERAHLRDVGWFIEGVGWTSPAQSGVPVFRLYNPNAGDHHYTMNASERDHLRNVGWRYEGVGWYSAEGKGVPVYRQYNPNARSGAHNFTTAKAENDNLVRVGWRAENIAWYAVGQGWAESMPAGSYNRTHLTALVNSVGNSGGIAQGYQTSVSRANLDAINQRLARSPYVSFVAVNARTGKCIAHNADWRCYAASAIKAPYIAALCYYDAPGISSQRPLMYSAITYSSNDAFDALCARYWRTYETRFGYESNVALNYSYVGCYVDLSPRELAKLWLTTRDYICSNSANAALFRSLFGNGGYFKEGWGYNDTVGGNIYHLAGIDGDVVYAIMSRYTYRDNRMWDLKSAIARAVS